MNKNIDPEWVKHDACKRSKECRPNHRLRTVKPPSTFVEHDAWKGNTVQLEESLRQPGGDLRLACVDQCVADIEPDWNKEGNKDQAKQDTPRRDMSHLPVLFLGKGLRLQGFAGTKETEDYTEASQITRQVC
mmetsp:Transcript_4110/g.7201  ORF Transcript_4110/g.7201 Transcript_4110/m.7201 type:complete len:132 (+) Transcript_4110:894-1289(+)